MSTNPTLTLYAAGSLRSAMSEIIARFEAHNNTRITCHYGPAGLLAARIAQGEPIDLFASANEAHVDQLLLKNQLGTGQIFICNRLCLTSRRNINLTPDNWLDRLLDPAITLSTSTPGCDPGGDYAQQLFNNIEQYHTGLGDLLRHKARHLLGGTLPSSPSSGANRDTIPAGARLVLDGHSDVHIGYASHIPAMSHLPDIDVMSIPSPYQVLARYKLGMAINLSSYARAFADYLLSDEGQNILIQHGFLPRHTTTADDTE